MSTVVRTDIDQLCVNTIRTLSMNAVRAANSGHPGAPMGLAPSHLLQEFGFAVAAVVEAAQAQIRRARR
jgi:hypothetical protein